jgi:hypothetical protein
MECRIQEEDLKSPRHMYPTVKVGKNRCNYLSVGEKFRTFSKENGIHDLDIPVRHIVLRSKSSSLPLLSNKADGEQGLFRFLMVIFHILLVFFCRFTLM